MSLPASDTTLLNAADHAAVQSYFNNISSQWTHQRWLSPTNCYRADVIARIKSDTRTDSRKTIPVEQDLGEYIAASALIHCFDGWLFLAAATHAELAGDPETTRHLGYYAELRAAMALLAAGGIGVFKNTHAFIGSTGNISYSGNSGTHEFVWNALSTWLTNTKGLEYLQQLIEPGRIPLKDWLGQFSGISSYSVSTLIKPWGWDLEQFAKDRSARNVSSYRPSTFTAPQADSIDITCEKIVDSWEVLNPEAAGGFPVLDRFLLRAILTQLFEQSTGQQAYCQSTSATNADYHARIENTVGNLSVRDLTDQQWIDFLTFKISPQEPNILIEARGTLNEKDPGHSKQVLARAVLLLRLATGSAGRLVLGSTSSPHSALQFWWSSPEVRGTIWNASGPPAHFSDLWDDIAHARDETLRWKQSEPARDHYRLWKAQPGPASVLSTFQRAALWGLPL